MTLRYGDKDIQDAGNYIAGNYVTGMCGNLRPRRDNVTRDQWPSGAIRRHRARSAGVSERGPPPSTICRRRSPSLPGAIRHRFPQPPPNAITHRALYLSCVFTINVYHFFHLCVAILFSHVEYFILFIYFYFIYFFIFILYYIIFHFIYIIIRIAR